MDPLDRLRADGVDPPNQGGVVGNAFKVDEAESAQGQATVNEVNHRDEGSPGLHLTHRESRRARIRSRRFDALSPLQVVSHDGRTVALDFGEVPANRTTPQGWVPASLDRIFR
jgi:hypothetical protein